MGKPPLRIRCDGSGRERERLHLGSDGECDGGVGVYHRAGQGIVGGKDMCGLSDLRIMSSDDAVMVVEGCWDYDLSLVLPTWASVLTCLLRPTRNTDPGQSAARNRGEERNRTHVEGGEGV